MNLLNPSLKQEVMRNIFLNACEANPIFAERDNLVNIEDQLISDIHPELCQPEDFICNQGTKAERFYFISKGSCEVIVTDHMKRATSVRSL